MRGIGLQQSRRGGRSCDGFFCRNSMNDTADLQDVAGGERKLTVNQQERRRVSMRLRRRAVMTGAVAVGVFGLWTPACGSSSNEGPSDAGADVNQQVGDPGPSSKTSTITADPGTLLADGTTTTKLTVVARRGDGSVVPNAQVTMTSSGKGAKFTPSSGETDQQGVFVATMTSTSAESKTINAVFYNNANASTQVNFQLCHGPLFLPRGQPLVVPGNGNVLQMVPADFNADGKLDLAVRITTTVSVFLGMGDGTFSAAPKLNVPVGFEASSLATGDLNGDNKADLLVVTSSNGSQTAVALLGNGDGTFKAVDNPSEAGGENGATLGDFNGDKKLDLATSTVRPVSIQLGTGDGHFLPSKQINMPAIYMISADLDGDGKLDLVAMGEDPDNNNAPTLSSASGMGDGNFSNPRKVSVPGPIWPFTIGNFDGDVVLDFVFPDTSHNNVDVVSEGVFGAETPYSVGTSPWGVTAGDFNADGQVDLAAVNHDSSNVSILLGHGNGTFASAINYPTIPSPSRIIAADFDGDEKTDLAIGAGNAISILLRSGCTMSAF